MPKLAIASLRGWRHSPAVWFVVHNRNHVRLFVAAAGILEHSGLRVRFADLDRFYGDEGAAREARRFGRATEPFGEIERRAGEGDKVVVANDWGPPPLVEGLVRAAARGALLIGMVEGAKAAEPRRYRLVHRVLAIGPASARLFPCRADIVGSPILDAAFAESTVVEQPSFAVINEKFVYDGQAQRAAWLDAAARACIANGLAVAVSPHPSGADAPPGADFADMMRRAALLVTRPSTVVFEAMARGKPVVVFPIENEPLYEFANGDGAFELEPDGALLAAAVARAVTSAAAARERGRAFLAEHIAYDPRKPAPVRIAAAIARAQRSAGT